MPTWKESLIVDVIARLRTITSCDNWDVVVNDQSVLFATGTIPSVNPVIGVATLFLSIGVDLKPFLSANNSLVVSEWTIAALVDGLKGMMPHTFFVRVESANLRLS